MSRLESARYMDYDYDNECIFGFDADEDEERENVMIFGVSSNAEISAKKLSPMQLDLELIGDAQWRKTNKQKMPPPPPPQVQPALAHAPPSLYTESPASAVSTNSLYHEAAPMELPMTPDHFDAKASDQRLRLCSSDGVVRPMPSKLDTVMREDAPNGLCYVAFGARVTASQSSATWRLILHGRSSMVLGLVGAHVRGVEHYVDCNDAAMRSMFGHDAYEGRGRVMEVRYDAKRGTLTARNINTESPRRGREVVAVRGVDVSVGYRLCVLLGAPATITMF